MVEEEMVTVFTVLSVRPPTEPMLRPCPPLHVPPVKIMLVPELIARQSSWLTLCKISKCISDCIRKQEILTYWHL